MRIDEGNKKKKKGMKTEKKNMLTRKEERKKAGLAVRVYDSERREQEEKRKSAFQHILQSGGVQLFLL